MMAVTSSTALVVLVAFGGFILPCFSSEDPYLELGKYLEKHAQGETLEDYVRASVLIDFRGAEFEQSSDDFKTLATAFRGLKDGKDEDLCDKDVLKNVRILVEASLDYKTSPDPDENADQFNQLLIKLKGQVLKKCYDHIISKWKTNKTDLNDENNYLTAEIEYINGKVKAQHYLFKRLIYCPKETCESTNSKFESNIRSIIFEALLDGNSSLKKMRLTSEQLTFLVNERLILPCGGMMTSHIGWQTAKPFRELLALEMMDSRKSKQFLAKRYNLIRTLPAYLICEWLQSKKDRPENLIKNFHKFLMNDSDWQMGSALQIRP